MKLVLKFVLLLMAITLAACASQSDYRAAENGGYGYSQTKLTDTQYRVYFKGRGSDKTKAMDYAMLRAAEITLDQGYDWFVVANRETLVDREKVAMEPEIGFSNRYTRVTDCGLVTCRTRYYPESTLSTGVYVGGREKSVTESAIDIQLGRGTRPDASASFDARQVKENLSAKTE